MSALWRNQLRIGLAAERLSLALYHRGLRPSLAAQSFVPLQCGSGHAHWQEAIAALPEALAKLPLNVMRPDVTVVLSDHFVRYALLAADPALKGKAEWLALARHRLTGLHGAGIATWTVRIAEMSNGGGEAGARLASATETALIEALDAVLIEHRATLVSLQPCLMAGYNQLRGSLGNEASWLVIEEPGRLTLALIEAGVWKAVRSRRVAHDWKRTLPLILERECALLGVERCTRAMIYAQKEIDAAAKAQLEQDEFQVGALSYSHLNYADLAMVSA